MTRISVLGATGKVGRVLCDEIAAAPDLELAQAIGSGGASGTVAIQEADASQTDVIVDFSTPSATLALLESLAASPLPVVLGTTGFSDDEMARLVAEGAKRPILIGANLTKGFEAFAAAGIGLAEALGEAGVTVREVYNAKKKPAASGTTQRLCADLEAAGRDPAVDIQRIGDTPGINTIVLDLGTATIELELTVHSRAAYAQGALDAARWLMGREAGVYRPHDMLSD